MRHPTTALKAITLVALGALAAYALGNVDIRLRNSSAQAAKGGTTLPPPSRSQIDEARSISRTFIQVAEQLKPSVVSLRVEKGGRRASHGMRGRRGRGRGRVNPFQGSPFEHFFFGPGQGGNGFEMPKQVGAGSGVVIDAGGYILTNHHVVEGADVIKVSFSDGHEAKGTIAGSDPKTDLAVIKVDETGLVPAQFGSSDDLQPGEWVIAIGNPYGFDHTVTVGVISAKGRYGVGGGPYEDFLQTDAAINPGNSGGPLINLDGEVIGINTAIKGIGTMIGFAIPSRMARPIARQLIDKGFVRRAYLGILMQDLTQELRAGLGESAPLKGAIVGKVEEDSPAARAKLRPGDVIVKIEGASVDGSKAVQRAVLSKSPGEKLRIDIWRDGKRMVIKARAGNHPSDDGERAVVAAAPDDEGKGRLGLRLEPLDSEAAEELGMKGSKGALVAAVRPDSPAAEAGIREGDVIVEVNRRRVGSVAEATKAFKRNRDSGHLVRLRRGNGAFYVVVPNA